MVLSVTGGLLFYLWNGLRPPAASSTPVQITISSGMRAQKVADVLEQSGLIRSAFLFSGWLKIEGEGSRFQAGVYELTPGMTREQIVAKLNNGDIVAAATIRFTIPEGFTVQQMAARLSETAGVDKAKFLEVAGKPELLTGSMWTKTLPTDNSLRFPLEGYLFPETYEMKRGSTEADIINRMLAELDHKLDQLPEDWQSTLEERGLTVHQLLTIASLVEREVVVDDERPIVSGVIQNRLKEKMPLQIDATIQYLLDKQKERLLEEDLKVESPYNTYLNAGLPPGPIATPSLKSIEAALYPEESDYFYYVTKKDGTNTHLFAVTYKQHQKNIQLSEKNVKK
ncbi:endolytic transglycosylase MltG [Cohnella luojiensis]|uniref:Endolytic murein transglycosylase n=2 Tax=Cohnella luojiensis TaxID=652876 RepID=A0A4Y8M956_9BACL|nr:endolytic transglycosylase MltG [Cohnella luojiensis]